jgi:hypothetical protein
MTAGAYLVVALTEGRCESGEHPLAKVFFHNLRGHFHVLHKRLDSKANSGRSLSNAHVQCVEVQVSALQSETSSGSGSTWHT